MGKKNLGTLKLPFKRFLNKGHKKNVYYLSDKNGHKLSTPYVYKYMPLNVFMLPTNTGLYFSEPSVWPDAFESRFYKADYTNICGRSLYRKLFACCVTLNNENEATWKNYVNFGAEYGGIVLRIKIKRSSLFQQFNTINNFDFFESPIVYKSEYFIRKLHKKVSLLYNKFFNDFDDDKFMSLLSVKRAVYEYENEIRYFAIPKEGIPTSNHIVIPWNDIIVDVQYARPFGKSYFSAAEISDIEKIILDKLTSLSPKYTSITVKSYNINKNDFDEEIITIE